MQERNVSPKVLGMLEQCQQNEIDEYHIYLGIAETVKSEKEAATLRQIANAELYHAKQWQRFTNREPKPRMGKVRFFVLLARLFGYTFALKRMESGENNASAVYQSIASEVPEAVGIAREEQEHEEALLELLDEERLQYVGSMVLGLNDALVELTGTLAGLSFALQNNRLVALSGLITGVSATFSMTASAYLSAKSDNDPNALKSCSYTGIMYLITVVLLVLPYLLLPVEAYRLSLAVMLGTVALIILGFNYYISVAKSYNFRQRFLEMFAISGSVAVLSFVVGLLVKAWLGIDL